MSALLGKILDAHGGVDRWSAARLYRTVLNL
jgi:hypothetical protein